MLFNFMTNLGPNAQTYLLAGEVFPTDIRGKGAGFAASFAKIGAVLTAFLFPVLLAETRHRFPARVLIATLAARRRGHLAVPHRDDRRQSGKDRALTSCPPPSYGGVTVSRVKRFAMALSRRIALRMVRSLRMAATKAALAGRPRALRRR